MYYHKVTDYIFVLQNIFWIVQPHDWVCREFQQYKSVKSIIIKQNLRKMRICILCIMLPSFLRSNIRSQFDVIELSGDSNNYIKMNNLVGDNFQKEISVCLR